MTHYSYQEACEDFEAHSNPWEEHCSYNYDAPIGDALDPDIEAESAEASADEYWNNFVGPIIPFEIEYGHPVTEDIPF